MKKPIVDHDFIRHTRLEDLIKPELRKSLHVIVEEIIVNRARTVNDIVHVIVDKYFTDKAVDFFIVNRVANFKYLKGRVYSHLYQMIKFGFFDKADASDEETLYICEEIQPSTIAAKVKDSFVHFPDYYKPSIRQRLHTLRLKQPITKIEESVS